ncbi:MAG: condensation domain-containing protein, partial [Bacteroidota bacterium]
GKLDKKALPDPLLSDLSTQAYVEPQTATEKSIAQIWQTLLEIEQIGIHHDFFDLGGHSLLVTRVISEIRNQLSLEISIRDLFQYTTVASLAAFIDTQEQPTDLPRLVRQERPAHIPLSYAQERLWFIDQLQGSTHYHMPSILKIRGALDFEIFERSFQTIINRHELLRTVIKEEQGQNFQAILPPDQWTLQVIQDRDLFDEDRLNAFVDEWVNRPFQLSEEHPIRVALIQMNEEADYLFVILLHHIASDGWSNSILIDEFAQLYRAFKKGAANPLTALPIQYADYAIWQRKNYDKVALEKQLDYWKTQLQEVPPLELTLDFPRPAIQSIEGDNRQIQLSQSLSQGLIELANERDLTPFMVFLAACKTLLYRHSGQQDICIGAPIAGRTLKEVESLIGFFINTLALRSQLSPELTFDDLLQSVKQTTLDAYANQMVPFEQIVEVLGVERDLSRTPIF